MAKSAHEALKKERRYRPDEVFVDTDWQKAHQDNLESCIGFNIEHEYYSSDNIAKNENTKNK
jgi:hypothetical protein